MTKKEALKDNTEKQNSLAETFSKELLDPTLDLATDYSEIFVELI